MNSSIPTADQSLGFLSQLGSWPWWNMAALLLFLGFLAWVFSYTFLKSKTNYKKDNNFKYDQEKFYQTIESVATQLQIFNMEKPLNGQFTEKIDNLIKGQDIFHKRIDSFKIEVYNKMDKMGDKMDKMGDRVDGMAKDFVSYRLQQAEKR